MQRRDAVAARQIRGAARQQQLPQRRAVPEVRRQVHRGAAVLGDLRSRKMLGKMEKPLCFTMKNSGFTVKNGGVTVKMVGLPWTYVLLNIKHGGSTMKKMGDIITERWKLGAPVGEVGLWVG